MKRWWWVVGGLVVVALLATVGIVVVRAFLAARSPFPDGYATKGYVVAADPAISGAREPDEKVREDVAILLAQRLRDADVRDARTAVRSDGVLVGVPAASKGELDRLPFVKPRLTIREVRAQRPSSSSECVAKASDPTVVCDYASGQLYEVGTPIVTGARVARARAAVTGTSGWQVSLTFDATGKAAFAAATARLVGKQAAIVLDGKLLSAPTIQAAIPGGAVDISGNLARDDARSMAAAIRIERAGAWARSGAVD